MADQERRWNAASRNLQSRFASMGLKPDRALSGRPAIYVGTGRSQQRPAPNLARRAVEQEGWNRRLGIAALGRKYPGTGPAARCRRRNRGSPHRRRSSHAASAARTAQGVTYLGDRLGKCSRTGRGWASPTSPLASPKD